MKPSWHTLPDYFIETFPELKGDIEESYLSWVTAVANPYPHFFLQEFLGSILVGHLQMRDPEARNRAGTVLDELLVSPDEDLAAAALTSIIETLRDEPELRAKAWPYLGPLSREWLERLTTP